VAEHDDESPHEAELLEEARNNLEELETLRKSFEKVMRMTERENRRIAHVFAQKLNRCRALVTKLRTELALAKKSHG
jgi:hypothetical protein